MGEAESPIPRLGRSFLLRRQDDIRVKNHAHVALGGNARSNGADPDQTAVTDQTRYLAM